MRQAQRDLELENGETIPIDGNMGRWGRPEWVALDSFFRKSFPDVRIILESTLRKY
ncbi:MAG: hypothetical protein V4489_02110 [Chlamydiota bacterium]